MNNRDGSRHSTMSDTRGSYAPIAPAKSSTQLKADRGAIAPQQRLLDVCEATKFLAVTVSTLYGWVWQRKISFVKLGRALRFDIADLEVFVDQNRVHPRRTGQP